MGRGGGGLHCCVVVLWGVEVGAWTSATAGGWWCWVQACLRWSGWVLRAWGCGRVRLGGLGNAGVA